MTSRTTRKAAPKADDDEEGVAEEQQPLIDEDAAAILAAAIAQATAGQQQAQAQGQFALTPAMAMQGPLDFASKTGANIFKQGTSSLYSSKDEPFNCEEGGLMTFLNRLSDRSEEMGWHVDDESIMMIPTSFDANNAKQGPFHNLITNYGQVTKERVQAWERKINELPDDNGRRKQDLFMLFKCITASLSMEGEQKLSPWRHEFVYDGIKGGLSLLYTITREASLVTNASIESLRRELNTLDEYAINMKGDIEKINTKAKLIVQKLQARGQGTTELITNLFKAYETIKDINFERFIANVRDRHDEGSGRRGNSHFPTAKILPSLPS